MANQPRRKSFGREIKAGSTCHLTTQRKQESSKVFLKVTMAERSNFKLLGKKMEVQDVRPDMSRPVRCKDTNILYQMVGPSDPDAQAVYMYSEEHHQAYRLYIKVMTRQPVDDLSLLVNQFNIEASKKRMVYRETRGEIKKVFDSF